MANSILIKQGEFYNLPAPGDTKVQSIAANGTWQVAAPAGANACYVASQSPLRVTIDGSAPTASSPLCPKALYFGAATRIRFRSEVEQSVNVEFRRV